jgi:hypothetical protein
VEPISVDYTPITDIEVFSTASSAEAALMRLGFSKSTAASAIPWLSLLGEDEPGKSLPAIHVVSKRAYTRASVNIEIEDLEPHPSFVLEVEQALGNPADAQWSALSRVFRRWGSLIATRIKLGCALVATAVFSTPCHLPVVRTFFLEYTSRNINLVDSSVSRLIQATLAHFMQQSKVCATPYALWTLEMRQEPIKQSGTLTPTWLVAYTSRP